MRQRPETTFKVGSARASVFRHTNTNRQTGESWDSYSVHLHRRYEESPGVWKSTSYFRFFEMPQVALVLELATEYVSEREAVVEIPDAEAGQDQAAVDAEETYVPFDEPETTPAA